VYGPRTTGLQTPHDTQFDEVMHTNVLAAMRILPIVLPLVENAGGRLACHFIDDGFHQRA
jgi:hypothetical protein